MLSFEEYYKEHFIETATTLQSLLEMPQYFPAKQMVYQKDSRFLPISPNNIASYDAIGNDGAFVYVVHPNRAIGYAINVEDLKQAIGNKTDVLPAMTVSLRDTTLNIKQAHALRIRERYSRSSVATRWYVFYVMRFGAIASDFEHLEGGMLLWKSLIGKAKQRNLEAHTHSFDTNEDKHVDASTPFEEIWSTTPDKKNTVIVLKKLQ